MKEQKFRKLDVWQKSMKCTEEVYKLTEKFPENELYGLTSQLRRAAISVSMNIAEGSASDSNIEFKRFLNISLKSAYEVMCGLEIAVKLNFCKQEGAESILNALEEISAMLTGLKNKLHR